MNDWLKNLEEHQVHKAISQLDHVLERFENTVFPKDIEVPIQEVNRIKVLRGYIYNKINHTDPFMISIKVLDMLASDLENINSEMIRFIDSQDMRYLYSAMNTVDFAIQHSVFPMISTQYDIEGMHEAITAFRRSLGQNNRHIMNEISDIQNNIININEDRKHISNDIDIQKSKVDTLIINSQQTINNHIQKMQEQTSDLKNEFQTKFIQAQEIRSEKTNEEMLKLQDSIQKVIREVHAELDTAKNHVNTEVKNTILQAHSDIQELLETITIHKDKAEEMLGIISASAMSGGYKEVADVEGKRAFGWHIIGIFAAIGLIGFAIYAFRETLSINVKWSVFGARIFVASSFALLAAYSERQANKHRHVERVNRRWQLILASVNPYLADLDESDQKVIKKSVAESVFTSAFPTDAKDDEAISADSMFDLIKNVATNLSRGK